MISDNNAIMNVFLDIQIDTDKSDWQQIEVDLLLWNSSLFKKTFEFFAPKIKWDFLVIFNHCNSFSHLGNCPY